MLCHGENRGCCFITYSDTVKEIRFLAKFLHSCRTFFEGGQERSARRGDYCTFAMIVGVEKVGATGGASKARMP